jgi:hypothetical protein
VTVSTDPRFAEGGSPAPHRAPLACGALGRYDRERVLAMATFLGCEMRAAHEGERALLMLDRAPIAWRGPKEHGLAWVEGVAWRDRATDWQAAARGGACGLAFRGRRPFLHSSVSGLGALYWLEEGGTVYFASRIDALAMTAPGRLSVDWEAWAAIIALRYPLGDRTPFAEIRRLGPFSTLRRGLTGRARARSHSWPWAQLEPHRDAEDAADDAADALRQALTLRPGPAICPLSGGLDSRLLTSTLAGLGRNPLTAVTVSDDEGGRLEEDLAAPVAAKLRIPHERIEARAEDYPAEWEERAALVEYQFVDHAWLVPLARRVADCEIPVTDGYALDIFLQTRARFYTPEVVEPPSPRAGSVALFDSVRQYGLAHLALDERLRQSVVERTRSQFHEVVRPFEGHPLQPILSLYASRTVRGISTYPSGLLGSRAEVVVPGIEDAVVTALLFAASGEKPGPKLQSALQERLAPDLVGMPSTGNAPRDPPRLPRRWCSPHSVEAHRIRIEGGPLAPFVSAPLRAWLAGETGGELSPDLRLGMEAISLFHAWWGRYRDQLRDVDPADLAG